MSAGPHAPDEQMSSRRVRLGWGIGDQALSSLANFLLGLVVARSTTAAGFGVFGVGYTAYMIAVGVTRALTSEPFVVRYSTVDAQSWRRGAALSTGTNLVLGSVGGAAIMMTGLIIGGEIRPMLLVLGVALPGLLYQDAWRYCFVANGRGHLAFAIDSIFLALLIPAFVILGTSGDTAPAAFVAAWGGAATLAGLVGAVLERLSPDVMGLRSWFTAQRDLAFRYLGEFAAVGGALQVTMLFVAGLTGLTGVGALRAGFLLFGPILVLYQGSRLALIPEGARALVRSVSALQRILWVLAIALPMCAMAWGGVLALIPDDVGRALLGDSWVGAEPLLTPLTLMYAAAGAQLAAVVGLRALAAARESLNARLIEGSMTLAGGVAGAAIGGAYGAAWGLAIAFILEDLVWAWWLRRAIRKLRTDAGRVDHGSR